MYVVDVNARLSLLQLALWIPSNLVILSSRHVVVVVFHSDASSANFWMSLLSHLQIDYTRSELASLEIYKELRGHYRMLVFSGTSDGAVPTTGTQNWIDELNWEIDEPYRAYRVNGQLAGYVEVREDNMFTFATIHGAGHMAAQWKRPETYHIIDRFIKDKRL